MHAPVAPAPVQAWSVGRGGPVAAAPPPPAPPPAPEPAPEPPPPPPKPPEAPEEAWIWALRSLNAHQRVMVTENAAFVSFAGGTLTLAVRLDRWKTILTEHLRDVDFPSALPGFRRLDIRSSEEGRTGREARTIEDEERLQAAREAVEVSPLVKRLVDTFGGRVEIVEASRLESAAGVEEGED